LRPLTSAFWPTPFVSAVQSVVVMVRSLVDQWFVCC
jgi:hypothetical protein